MIRTDRIEGHSERERPCVRAKLAGGSRLVHRVLELLIVTSWLASMTWLVARDALPRWFAQAPPEAASAAWLKDQGTAFQYGIYDQSGLRRGSCWSLYEVSDEIITRHDLLVLEKMGLLPTLTIESELTYLNETELATLDIEIKGQPMLIELHGERQGPKFGFELKIGRVGVHEFVLDAQAAQTLCDLTKPFSSLRGLEVGRSWKIHVIDPWSLIQQGRQTKLRSVVVSVTGRETIQIEGRKRSCWIVESPGARAWVDDAGRVLRQVVTIPGVGQLEIREQTFQRDKYDQMLRNIRGVGRHGGKRDRAD